MAVLLPEGKQSYETLAGIPLVGGRVGTFDAGTSNPRVTWSDAAGTAPNTNPVILDARGEATIFWSGSYKVVLSDSLGNVIWTQDNVSSISSSNSVLDNYSVDTGVVNAYVVASATVINAYVPGLRVAVKIANTNTGASTLNYMGLGAKSITLQNGAALVGGEIFAGGIYELEYDGTNFQLLDPAAAFWIDSAEVIAGITPTDYSIPSYEVLGFVHAGRYGCSTANPDNAIAINKAVAVAKAAQTAFAVPFGNMTVYLGIGIFKLASSIVMSGANLGIVLRGAFGALQQGSGRPATTLRWTGGNAPIIASSTTYNEYYDIAFENAGTATAAIRHTDGGHQVYQRLSIQDAGLSNFSDALISITQPASYSIMRQCEFSGSAPFMILYNGNNAPSQGTSFQVSDCIMDQSVIDQVFLKIVDGSFETISIHNNTFNTQTPTKEFCIVDMSACGANSFDTVQFDMNECDSNGSPAAQRWLKLKNVRCAQIRGGSWFCNGAQTAAVSLENSTVDTFEGVTVRSLTGPVFELLDSVSQVFPGRAHLVLGNTQNYTNATSGLCGIVDVTYAAAMDILGHLGHPGRETTYRINVNNNTNMTISQGKYTDSAPHTSNWQRGQKARVLVRNISGAPMGTVTFDASFKTAGAFTVPTNGNSRNILFEYDGANLVELSRSAADVAN